MNLVYLCKWLVKDADSNSASNVSPNGLGTDKSPVLVTLVERDAVRLNQPPSKHKGHADTSKATSGGVLSTCVQRCM